MTEHSFIVRLLIITEPNTERRQIRYDCGAEHISPEWARQISRTVNLAKTHTADKFPVLDGLRAISILLVLACHLLPLGPKAVQLNGTAGAMGMSLFFALSGFLITSALITNQSISEFATRRLARILPLAYLYTIVVFLIFSFDLKATLWTDLFLVNYVTQYLTDWNAHFWSLCVEMQFYFGIALVVLIGGRKSLWIVWPACLAITLLRVNAGEYINIRTHLRVDEILSGACVATLWQSGVKFKVAPGVALIAALVWAFSAWPLAGGIQYFRPYTAALLLLASLNYGAVNPNTLLASRPLRYIATISYALYIIHPATAHGWMSEGGAEIKYLIKRPISLVLTFLLAHISTFYWENRWQSAARRWLKKRRSMQAAEVAIAPVIPLR
jgi:peptidoglycan/LPS O-acetylase OafA/YrhL